MPRKGHRVRVAKGIYRDGSGLAAVVSVGTRRKELRFPPDTPLLEIRAAVDQMRAQLRATAPKRSRGTLAADAKRYEKQIKDTVSWREAMAEVRAWLALYGTWRRSRITREQVRIARAQWLEAGKAWKTINNRVWRLGHLYHVLDGDEASTPVDGLKSLTGPRAVARRVSVDVVNRVEANLRAREAAGILRNQKSRARFLVLAATGRCRPRAAGVGGPGWEGRVEPGLLPDGRRRGCLAPVYSGRRLGSVRDEQPGARPPGGRMACRGSAVQPPPYPGADTLGGGRRPSRRRHRPRPYPGPDDPEPLRPGHREPGRRGDGAPGWAVRLGEETRDA